MPEWIEVQTQDELDEALARPNTIPVCRGDERFAVTGTAIVRAGDTATVEASGSATVEAWGSASVEARDTVTVAAWERVRVDARGSATVEAWDRARVDALDCVTVRLWGWATVNARGSVTVKADNWSSVSARDSASVEAWHFSTVSASDSATVKAWDSATVRAGGTAKVDASGSTKVEASGSASVRAWGSTIVNVGDTATVRAWGSTIVRVWGAASVEASKHVSVTRHGDQSKVSGGVVCQVPGITTAEEWCEFYGVEVENGVATLYKAVDGDFRSRYGMSYRPGSKPQAPDWDGGERDCGGGLHFSPSPSFALQFQPSAARYVACPVRVEDIVVNPVVRFQDKVKAKGVCAPVYEVDEWGEPL